MMKQRENFKDKIVLDYGKIERIADGFRAANKRIVVTIGSWDLFHVGHARYLLQAALQGDALLVGVDSNRTMKLYKGPMRPAITEEERMELLSHLDYVDYITLIDDVDERGDWQYELIKTIRPDVFVAVENSYPEEQLAAIRQHCEKVVVLPPQGKTSTSVTIHTLVKKYLEEAGKNLEKLEKRKL
ncbi:adenylyltransferase/cytidyltransferase family protein [Candidatus Azambacteria bacterium]|nr:adenylyltransferase/cytidyltransferase family protein [Candidatus Azambacteria bacterium]